MGEQSFLFVHDGKNGLVDSKTRKLMRRHVMNGKNAGKTVYRRSRRDLHWQTLRPLKDNAPVFVSNEGVCKEKDECMATNVRIFGDPFRSFAYPVQTTAYSINVINQYFTNVLNRFFPCLIGVSHDESRYWWFHYLLTDEGAYHCTIALAETLNHFVRGGESSSQEALYHRSRSLNLVTKRLASSQALSDATLGMITMLIIEEQLKSGPSDALIHYNGLVRLVELRGGLRQLESCPALLLKICKLDIMLALQYNQPVKFFRDYTSEVFSVLESTGLLHDRILTGSSCLPNKPGPYLDRVLLDTMQIASILNDLTTGKRMDQFLFQKLCFSIMYRLIRFQPLQNPKIIGGMSDIEAAFHIGLVIFTVTLILQCDSRRVLRLEQISSRFQTIIEQKLDTLSTDVALWLITIGGIWAAGASDDSWLHFKLQILASRTGIRSWNEVHLYIKNFPWVHFVHDVPGRALWKSAFVVTN